MLNLFTYKTPVKYSFEFKEAYSYNNVKQVKLLSTVLFLLASSIRLLAYCYHPQISSMPNVSEYNLSNLLQIISSSSFMILSSLALKQTTWKTTQKNFLTLAFATSLLAITFFVSYIYSMHNAKNTLTVFLVGIMIVSLFFSLEFKYILSLALFVILLFAFGMIVPELNPAQQLFNFVASVVLAFVLYICSRYSYFYKSQHFVQLKQLQEKNTEVQELNRQKGEILAFVAHDLRNPLNNIEALSRIVLEDSEQDNSEVKLILSSAKQAKEIINDLIEVIQVKKSPFELEPTELITYVAGICRAWHANTAYNREINFLTSETELHSSLNRSKFSRVLDNLIGNGLKFSGNDTPIDVSVYQEGNSCRISIRDYGIGIPEHLKEMLFDQFSKAGRAGLKGEKSLGLGLHISKDIIEQHGGTLTIETEEHKGTTFIIAMPLAS